MPRRRIVTAEERSRRKESEVRAVLISKGLLALCSHKAKNEQTVEVWTAETDRIYLDMGLEGLWHLKASWTFRNDPLHHGDAILEQSSVGLHVEEEGDKEPACLFRYDFDNRRHPVSLHVHAKLPPKQRSGTHWPLHVVPVVAAEAEWDYKRIIDFFISPELKSDLMADGWKAG